MSFQGTPFFNFIAPSVCWCTTSERASVSCPLYIMHSIKIPKIYACLLVSPLKHIIQYSPSRRTCDDDTNTDASTGSCFSSKTSHGKRKYSCVKRPQPSSAVFLERKCFLVWFRSEPLKISNLNFSLIRLRAASGSPQCIRSLVFTNEN